MGVNPIKTVYYGTVNNNHSFTATRTFSSVPCPSAFEYTLNDVSENDAGRTEDYLMNKKRVGQAIKIKLEWKNVETSVASTVLAIFNEEYVIVEYLDPMVGEFVKKEFYVGDRSSPLYNASMGVWNKVSFNLTEREAGFVYKPYESYNSEIGCWEKQSDTTVKYGKNGLTLST